MQAISNAEYYPAAAFVDTCSGPHTFEALYGQLLHFVDARNRVEVAARTSKLPQSSAERFDLRLIRAVGNSGFKGFHK
jgi:hypothetical protein